ncbi:hypothetical protein SARC_14584, partial [Sphaeroforma arctica JP610]
PAHKPPQHTHDLLTAAPVFFCSDMRFQMSSFAEGSAKKKCDKDGVEYADYSTRQISRTYPSGKRIDSTNYNPIAM